MTPTRRSKPRPQASPAPDPVAAARGAALKLLAGRDLSRRELAGMLSKRHKPAPVENALEELARLGLQSDRRAAESLVRQRLSDGAAARALLEAELERRGIDNPLAAAVLDAMLADRSEDRDALELAREKVRTAPARLTPVAVLRRAFAFLIRRGYDEETARQAVESAGEEYLGRP